MVTFIKVTSLFHYPRRLHLDDTYLSSDTNYSELLLHPSLEIVKTCIVYYREAQMPVFTRPWKHSKEIVTNANSPRYTSPSVHATHDHQRYGSTRRKLQVHLNPRKTGSLLIIEIEFTRSSLLSFVQGYTEEREGRCDREIVEDRKVYASTGTCLLHRKYFTRTCAQAASILRRINVTRGEKRYLQFSRDKLCPQQRGSKPRGKRRMARVFSRRNFYSVLSVHVYTVFTLLSRARILRARCASGNNTGYFRWWCMSPALREMVRWARRLSVLPLSDVVPRGADPRLRK